MNPKEAFNIKTNICSNSSFPRIFTDRRQDVAPFIPHNKIMCDAVAKASKDLIPPPFVMRMQLL